VTWIRQKGDFVDTIISGFVGRCGGVVRNTLSGQSTPLGGKGGLGKCVAGRPKAKVFKTFLYLPFTGKEVTGYVFLFCSFDF
jgi:hypothetical protein